MTPDVDVEQFRRVGDSADLGGEDGCLFCEGDDD